MQTQLASRTAVGMRRTAHVLALAAALSCALAAVILLRFGLAASAGMPSLVHYATAGTLLAGATNAAAAAVRIRRQATRSPLLLAGLTAFHLTLLYYCIRIVVLGATI